jgi:hypothetical protein
VRKSRFPVLGSRFSGFLTISTGQSGVQEIQFATAREDLAFRVLLIS